MGRVSRPADPQPLCRLVRFDAEDGVELPGLLYEPARATKRAAIWLHGSGGASIFDSARTNVIADELTRAGLAFLPFNNRGAHVVRRLRRGTRRRSVAGGFAMEKIRDAVHDISGAIAFMRRQGYRDLTLIGHSTGANKIVLFDHYRKRNPARRYVLLAGGDDTGALYERLGSRRFRASLERARSMLAQRRGEELIPPALLGSVMSWQSFLDMANPDGDYNVFPFHEAMRGIRLSSRRRPFRYLGEIGKPALVVYGENDEYCFGDVSGCVATMVDAIGPKSNFEFAIMKDADHGFGGRYAELGALIAEWMRT